MAVTESHSVGGDNPGQYERPDSHPSGSSQASDSFCPGSGLTSGGQIGNSKNNYNSVPGGVLCQWSQSDARAVQRPLGVLYNIYTLMNRNEKNYSRETISLQNMKSVGGKNGHTENDIQV